MASGPVLVALPLIRWDSAPAARYHEDAKVTKIVH
jgi:hypothetical protein